MRTSRVLAENIHRLLEADRPSYFAERWITQPPLERLFSQLEVIAGSDEHQHWSAHAQVVEPGRSLRIDLQERTDNRLQRGHVQLVEW